MSPTSSPPPQATGLVITAMIPAATTWISRWPSGTGHPLGSPVLTGCWSSAAEGLREEGKKVRKLHRRPRRGEVLAGRRRPLVPKQIGEGRSEKEKATDKDGQGVITSGTVVRLAARMRAALRASTGIFPCPAGIPRGTKFPCDSLAEPARHLPGRKRGGTVPLRGNDWGEDEP